MMWYGYGNLGWLGWTLMSLSMVAFWGLLIWAVVALTRGAGPRREPPAPEAQDVLARRFAAGEIDIPTYEQSRALLSDRPAPSSPVFYR